MALALLAHAARAQTPVKIPLSFLPPPLEHATYSVGIYDAKTGRLARRLQEFAPESAFTAGLNGLLTTWDGKDDAGQPAVPGRYAGRGYAVGALKIAGEGILGNDWAKDDETLRIREVKAIALVPNDGGLAVLGNLAPGAPAVVARYGGEKTVLLWHKISSEPTVMSGVDLQAASFHVQKEVVVVKSRSQNFGYCLSDGAETNLGGMEPLSFNRSGDCEGKGGTLWKIEEGVLTQYSPAGERLRTLVPDANDPLPIMVAASKTADLLYLLEEASNWQRVRGLSWKETTQKSSQPVSTWQTFFERSIRAPDPALGLDAPAMPAEITLVENPLAPGKPQKAKLAASFDAHGSYLATADGLRLRPVSQRANLQAAKLVKGKAANALAFYQYDGAAWDEFSIAGARNLMAFDAGEFDLTADGTEKPHPEKAAEPPDL